MYSQYSKKQIQKYILTLEWLYLTCKAMLYRGGSVLSNKQTQRLEKKSNSTIVIIKQIKNITYLS